MTTRKIEAGRLANTTVTAGTYGNSSILPQLTVDAQGRITNSVGTAIKGVSNVTYTAANNTLTITTPSTDSFDVSLGSVEDLTVNGNTVLGSNSSDSVIINSPVTANTDVTITGNLTVSGTTTYINTTQLDIGDNIIVLNADETLAPTANAGIEVERGTDTNVSFLFDEGNDRWDASANLNVQGTVTADGLTVSKTGTGATIAVERTDGSAFSLTAGVYSILGTDDSTNLYLKTNSAFRQLIKDSGDVVLYADDGASQDFYWDASTSRLGLGTTSPSAPLHIEDSTNPELIIANGGGTSPNPKLTLYRQSGVAGSLSYDVANKNFIFTNESLAADSIIFKHNSSAEAMRIDSSGNLLVGTITDSGNGGVSLSGSGQIYASRAGTVQYLNRESTDGTILQFNKDGSSVGSIGVYDTGAGLDVYFADNVCGIRASQAGTDNIMPCNADGSNSDADIDLGAGAARWRDLFLANSMVVTNSSTASVFKVASNVLEIGTTSIDPVTFITNNTDRMTITSDGNVGIGTTTPSSVNSGSDDLVIGDGSGNRGLSVISGTASLGLLTFHDAFNTTRTGGLEYDHSDNSLGLRANNLKSVIVSSSGHMLPTSNNTYDLGSTTEVWRNVYTGDLHLSNEGQESGNEVDGTKGNWSIQEGSEHLYIINNKSGKKYRFALEEIE